MVAHLHRQLYRSGRDRVLLGVAGGLGEYFCLDPVLIRVLFVLGALVGGVGLLAYLVLAIVVPAKGDGEPVADCESGVDETARGLWAGGLAGLAVVGLGLLFLASELGWLDWVRGGVVWSLLLIVLGAVVLLRRAR